MFLLMVICILILIYFVSLVECIQIFTKVPPIVSYCWILVTVLKSLSRLKIYFILDFSS